MRSTMADATNVLHVSPVIPVVTIEDPQHAVPVARALADGGVRIIELTLRTDTALTSLKAIASEVLDVLERGLDTMKFFPAGPAGGPSYLAAIGAPVPQVTFCPTGGISLATAPDYLKLANVSCVGGSWLTPRAAVDNGDWQQISE